MATSLGSFSDSDGEDLLSGGQEYDEEMDQEGFSGL